MTQPIPTVAVIVGSLANGTNRKFADALAKLAAGRLDFRFVEIGDLPLYNYELEADFPAAAARLKAAVESADAVLFVTPEYLRSIPAALKNAIEWGARPWGKNSWEGKPASIVGATPGAIGTAVAQTELRAILSHLGAALHTRPEVYFQVKPETYGDDGAFADAGALHLLNTWIDSFATWIARLNQPANLARAS